MSEKLQNPNTIQDQQHDFQNAVITVTEKAVKQLKIAMKSAGDENQILRMSVEGGGCSGFQYGFQFEEQKEEDDLEFERDGVRLLVDSMSFQYLAGSEIDFIDDLMGTRFVVSNPNAATTCGCGSSFGV